MGVPIGGVPSPVREPLVATMTVTSVGPYAFTIRRPGAHRAARSGGHASPPTTSTPRSGNSRPERVASADGEISACVTCSSVSTLARRSPATRPGGGSTRVPPAAHARQTSRMLASNPAAANCSTRAPGPAANRSSSAAANAPTPAWVTTTPFGVPVEPDVKITYAGCARDGRTPRGTGPAGRSPRQASVTDAPAAVRMNSRRSAGSAGSTGRYAAPACTTATSSVSHSGDRGIDTATTDSGPGRPPATRAAAASSAAYVTATSPHTTATPSGTTDTAPANNPPSDTGAPGSPVWFQAWTSCARSASVTTGTRRNGVSGAWVSNRTRPAVVVAMSPQTWAGSMGASASTEIRNPSWLSSTDSDSG